MPTESSPTRPEAGSPPPLSVDPTAVKHDTHVLIGSRLEDLRTQQALGLDRLAQLQRETAELQATLLRIGGAITVLEELTTATEKE